MGDGELAEGQLWEAAMASAARYKVDNLTAILDRNHIQATGPTKDIFDIPDIEAKWRAFGWNVINVDGHNVAAVLEALDQASATKGVPTIIVAETINSAKASPSAENTAAFHNGIMTQEQYDKALLEIEEKRRMLQ